MRAARIVRHFLEWRWAPCVALTAGALAYVGLAVLLIPSELGSGPSSAGGTAVFARPSQLPNTAFASSLTQSSFESMPSTHEATPRPAVLPRAAEPVTVPRRGFSPPIEQPEAPPPPPPPPPPPVVQAPVVQPPAGVPGMQAPGMQAAPVPTTQPAVPSPAAPPPPPEPTSAGTPPPPATPGVFEEAQQPQRPAPAP